MVMDQKKIDKLIKRWQKADAAWKKAAKKSQEACAAYHWTAADDGAKWNRARAWRVREAAAFARAELAREALETAVRHALNPRS